MAHAGISEIATRRDASKGELQTRQQILHHISLFNSLLTLYECTHLPVLPRNPPLHRHEVSPRPWLRPTPFVGYRPARCPPSTVLKTVNTPRRRDLTSYRLRLSISRMRPQHSLEM